MVMHDWKPSYYSNDFSSFSSYININIKYKRQKVKDKRLINGGCSIWSWTIGNRQIIVSDVAS